MLYRQRMVMVSVKIIMFYYCVSKPANVEVVNSIQVYFAIGHMCNLALDTLTLTQDHSVGRTSKFLNPFLPEAIWNWQSCPLMLGYGRTVPNS